MRIQSTRFMIPALLVLASGTPAAARDLSLQQAVESAITGNPAVAASAAQAEAATARSKQAGGFRLPSIDLMEAFNYTDNPAEVFAFSLNQGRFDMEEFFLSDPNHPGPLNTWFTRIEITQPIYTGGALSSRVDQAELMQDAASLDHQHSRERVAFDVATAFANATKGAEHRDVVERAYETTAAHVRLAEQYAEQGLIIDAEVLNARVHLAEVNEMMVEARANADLALSALAFHMGIDQSTRYDLAPLPPTPATDQPLSEWVEGGVSQRRDLEARRQELGAGQLEEKAARSGYLPEVGIKGRYELYDDRIFGSNGHSGSVMAVAKINLYRGGSDSARIEAARQDALSGAENIRHFEEGIRLEVRGAYQAVHTARTKHLTAVQAVAAAREALRVREQRFKQGLDKMIDLLDAETAVRESELRELVVRYDLTLATYRLFFTSGASLIELFGITVPEENAP